MLSDTELDSVLNLTNYMNLHPVVVPSDASVSRAYRLFRTLGMRHMLVGDAHPRLRGLLTRKDLTEENAELYGPCYTDHGHNYALEATVQGTVAAETGIALALSGD